MAHVDYQRGLIRFHILFWGRQGSGILESLRYLHGKTPAGEKGPLQLLKTEAGLVACFRFRPSRAGRIQGFQNDFFVTGCPASSRYMGTRNLLFDLVDGVVFAAPADPRQIDATVEHWSDLVSELTARDLAAPEFPVVFQWNVPDQGGADTESLARRLDPSTAHPSFRANPATGRGLIPVLDTVCLLAVERFRSSQRHLEATPFPRGHPSSKRGATPAPGPAGAEPEEALKRQIEKDHSGTAIFGAARPAKPSAGRSAFYLDVFLQDALWQSVELPRVGEFTIGRGRTCDLVLDEAAIHNCQGALVISDYGVFLQCNYPDEVWINSTKAGSGAWLREGDRVQMGRYYLHVRKRKRKG